MLTDSKRIEKIEKIYNFSCPSWDDLPCQGLMSKDLVSYINKVLSPIYFGKLVITKTMVQNYSKWGIIPKIEGRKYYREQISILIMISVYKQIIDIASVKAGIRLQLRLVSVEKGYNYVADCLNRAIKRTFSSVVNKSGIDLKEVKIKEGLEGVELVANAFAYTLLTKMIVDNDGYKNLIEEKNE